MRIVIVGGGTAGWLTAGLLAATRHETGAPRFHVTMIEPPDIPIIGVGEGTWPTMRETLRRIGVSEKDFLRVCNASFKQGSKFCGWSGGADGYYYHPFEPPKTRGGDRGGEHGGDHGDEHGDGGAARAWLASDRAQSFSNAVSHQERLCEAHLAPKMATSPDYAGVVNYGYHFNAGALAGFLRDHCTEKLGVHIVADAMTGVDADASGAITSIGTRTAGPVAGDFFIDCTGLRALLMKGHFGVGTTGLGDVLLADRALAAQILYGDDEPIRSVTTGTAQDAGWIWDIGLSTRRGVGYVHSSSHCDTAAAEATLRAYLSKGGVDPEGVAFRLLKFSPGHLERFWVHNCAAVGLSAGFVEPLEASAIMLTELAARELCRSLSGAPHQATFREGAETFNGHMTAHWRQVVHFLKLHYVLSDRPEPFWRDNRDARTVPTDLAEDLAAWATRPPCSSDLEGRSKIFPPESYQYVLYGAHGRATGSSAAVTPLDSAYAANEALRYRRILPSNRALIG